MEARASMTIEEEWAAAIHILYPRQVAAMLLQFERPDLTGERLVLAELVTNPGQTGETTLQGDREMLVPLLEAELERRMLKSAHRQGKGT
jgi:hypothetical protein